MKQITSYGFNMDTACVELRFSDETAVTIDTITVENEFAETWLDRRELDYLIYNDPLGYADLVLNGDVKKQTPYVRIRISLRTIYNTRLRLKCRSLFGGTIHEA